MTEHKTQSSNFGDQRRVEQLEMLLQAGKIGRRRFVKAATAAGLTAFAALSMAEKALAVASNQTELKKNLAQGYDYVVIGAGSSGSVVARRLAENPAVSVLLLEAGGSDDAPSIVNPAVWFTNIGGPFDWGYKTTPQRYLNNRSIPMPMGKAIGGGSSINATIWARGHKNDFDQWALATKDPLWGYEHVLEIYRRIEDWQGVADPLRRGKGGLVYVQPAYDPSPLAPAFLQGCASAGIPIYDDQNAAMMEGNGGAAIANQTIKDGLRRNVPSHYLYPIMDQSNITILTKASVNRLLLDGKKVTGVEFEWDGQTRRIQANAEVVLSAGAINTPKILMLSGIGDATDLRKLGIQPVVDLPGVGKNYQDHIMVAACMWEAPQVVPPRNSCAEATFFWKTDQSLPTPDLQPFMIEVPFASEVHGANAVPAGWSIAPGIVKPKSRGFLKLKGSGPDAAIEIHANALENPADMKALRYGVELSREIGNSAAMKPFVKREIMPGAAKGRQLDDFIRNGAVSYFHETCTAKMGTDKMSVVDAKLRVYGIKNLRIADGSVMPNVTTGNTMAPCVIIGERMAEIFRAG